MKSVQSVIALFGIVCLVGSHGLLIDDVRKQVIKEVNSTWRKVQNLDRDGMSVGEMFSELAVWLKEIPRIVNRVDRELEAYDYNAALQTLGRTANFSNEWKQKWDEISTLTSAVGILYGDFKLFPSMPSAFVPGSKELDFDASTFAEMALKPLYRTESSTGMLTFPVLMDLANTAATDREKNPFDLLHEFIDESLGHNHYCLWNQKTPQRIVYGFYVSLLTLDVKEYVIKNFAWMVSNVVNGTSVGNQAFLSTAILNDRADRKYQAAYQALTDASPAFWQCDPEAYVEGRNYEQFKELLQGYIENEVNMHPTGSCKQSCKDFGFTKAPCAEATDAECHKKRVCAGNLVECSYVAADATVCLSPNPPRRFDYIHYKRGPNFGSDNCTGVTERRDSHWRFWYHCSNCFCLCDDPSSPTTVRQISLKPVTSDIESNKIITGIKFVMVQGVLYLQIEEGVPERNGFILDGSTEWISVDTVNKADKQQVLTMDYLNRAMDLDDVILQPNHVVTGIRFRHFGSHTNLEVQATQIDPSTGELVKATSHWIANDNTPHNHPKARDELLLEDPDIPTRTKYPSIPDSVHDQFVNFGASSASTDASQTTVPFVDTQPVRPNPPMWLQGIGIYHKGQPKYGGFVAPRLFTWNIGEFFENHHKQ